MTRRLTLAYVAVRSMPSTSAHSIHIAKMCQAFCNTGVNTRLICPNRENASKVDLWEHYGTVKNYDINFVGKKEFLSKYDIVKTLARLKLKGVNVIYTRHIATAYTATLLGLSTVLETHAPIDEKSKDFNYFKKTIKSKNLLFFVVITKALREHYQHQYDSLNESNTLVFADGADPVTIDGHLRDQFRSEHLNNQQQTHLAYTGSIRAGKGLDQIYAIAMKLPVCCFHIVGGDEQAFYNLIGTEKRLSNIICHGYRKTAEIPLFLSGMDILLAPYQDSVIIEENNKGAKHATDIGKWMSPLKLFEYMASGVPIVTSNLPVLKEVMNDNLCYMLESNDIEQWVSVIKSIINNSTAAKIKAASAKTELENKYTWNIRASNLTKEIVNRTKHPLAVSISINN